jgi:hypothetical protein
LILGHAKIKKKASNALFKALFEVLKNAKVELRTCLKLLKTARIQPEI